MAARRCALCGISYPSDPAFAKCPVHDRTTEWIYTREPDPDWKEQLAVLREQVEAKPHDDDDELIPAIQGRVKARGDKLFVSAWDVYSKVRRRLEPGDLIRVGKQTFEIVEYIHDQREYWVTPFSVTLSDEDLARLASAD